MKIKVTLSDKMGVGAGKKLVIDAPANFWEIDFQARTNFLDEKFGKGGWDDVYAVPE